MSMLGVNGALAAAYQYANKTKKTATSETGFTEQLQKTGETKTAKEDAYTEYLKQKYGLGVSTQTVGKDQRSMDRLGAGTAGTGNVVIASNILEEMAKDPEKAVHYEEKIQDYFNSLPRVQAEISAMGHEIHSSGIVIHSDGTVTHYISGDLKPEVRAKIKAKMKAEDEAKAKRKRQYKEHSEEAAERRKQYMDIAYRKQNMTELIADRKENVKEYTYMAASENLNAVIAAYKQGVMEAAGVLV